MRTSVCVPLVLLFFLQACSPQSTPPPTSKPTLTPTFTQTPTATVTPTITPSPTIIKIPTVDYSLALTMPVYQYSSPTPFPWIPTSSPAPTPTPSSPGEGFEWVRAAETRLYWGVCRSSIVNISAQVTYPEDVYSMTLFVRLRRLTANILSDWNAGLGMVPVGGEGVWAYDLHGTSVPNHSLWRRGWVSYQLVAVGKDNVIVGRSRIFVDAFKFEPCMCLTPPCGPRD